jgi:hypothetical protein
MLSFALHEEGKTSFRRVLETWTRKIPRQLAKIARAQLRHLALPPFSLGLFFFPRAHLCTDRGKNQKTLSTLRMRQPWAGHSTRCKKEYKKEYKKTCGSTVFSTGHPRQYSLAPAMLICADRTRRGGFIAVWPQIKLKVCTMYMYPKISHQLRVTLDLCNVNLEHNRPCNSLRPPQ